MYSVGRWNDKSFYLRTLVNAHRPNSFGSAIGSGASRRDLWALIGDAARELVRLRDAWLGPPDCAPEELKRRTLTNLYNQRPEWLGNAHSALDRAVFTAYGWPDDLTREEILARLLALNHERAATQGD